MKSTWWRRRCTEDQMTNWSQCTVPIILESHTPIMCRALEPKYITLGMAKKKNQTYWSKQSTPGSVVPLAMFWNSLLTGLLGHYFQHKNVASYSSCWHHRWKGNLCSKNSKSMRHPACTLELFKPRWMVCLIAKVLNHKADAFSASNTIHAFLAK